jgi:hypothetical protein
MRSIGSWMIALALVGCAAPGLEKGPGDELEADADDLAADSLSRPLDHGTLAFGVPSAAQIGPQRYHAWQFTLHGDARVSVSTQAAMAGGPMVDTVLALYRRGANGRWGTALVRNDDFGGTLWSRVERALGAGEYRVIVRGYSRLTSGPFAVLAQCEGPGCGVATPTTGCHPAIADAIRACQADRLADPDVDPSTLVPLEVMRACADPEVVASAWDALCLGASAPLDVCGADLEEFTRGHLVTCRNALVSEALDASCVFGPRYRDLFGGEGPLVVRWARVIDAPTGLTPTEVAQILRAVRETAHGDVARIEDVFALVDDGVVNQTWVWDASGRRAFVVYEVGAGDNSFGAYFPVDGVEPVARNVDGDVLDCAVTWGAERRRCSATEPCAEGLVCEGVEPTTGFGRCLARVAESDPRLGASCATDGECGTALVCAGASDGGEGLCNPAWMRGRYATRPDATIPDGAVDGVEVHVPVYGLATVSTDARIDLYLTHPRIAELRVILVNPAGTEVTVFGGERDGSELYLRGVALRGFPGDESVNGVWTLRVIDTRRGNVGTVHELGLELTSRWD